MMSTTCCSFSFHTAVDYPEIVRLIFTSQHTLARCTYHSEAQSLKRTALSEHQHDVATINSAEGSDTAEGKSLADEAKVWTWRRLSRADSMFQELLRWPKALRASRPTLPYNLIRVHVRN